MKTPGVLVITIFAFVLGLSWNNFALSKFPPDFNVAVVDVQQVISNSSQANSLQFEQNKKMRELKEFVDDAKNSLVGQTNEYKKKTMEDNYNKELNERKNALDKEYSKKLLNIEKNIMEVIKTKAQSLNYDLVLTKNSVLYGGTDITNEISKAVK